MPRPEDLGWTHGARPGQEDQGGRPFCSRFLQSEDLAPGTKAGGAAALPGGPPTLGPGRLTTPAAPARAGWAGPGHLTILIPRIAVLGGGSVQLQETFYSVGLGRGSDPQGLWEGPARGHLSAPLPHPEATKQDRAGGPVWGERGLLGARAGGGPVAACRAPPSSLPGSIRDLTPSNAAQ